MVPCTMGVSLLEHQWNEVILEEARVEPIATVMRSKRLDWFKNVKSIDEKEDTAEKEDGGKATQVDVVRRDTKAWKIGKDWTKDSLIR